MSEEQGKQKEIYEDKDPSHKMTGPNATTIPFGTTFGDPETGDMYGKTRARWGDTFASSLSSSGSKNRKPMASEIDNPEDVTIGEETSVSFKRLFQSQYNLALIFGSVGVEAIVNHIAKVVLNTDDLDNINEDEAINNLKQKLEKLSSITKNPKTREAFAKASAAIGDIFLIFVEHANEPMMKIGERATKISFHVLTIMFNQAMETLEDSLMLIPIFGEGYMIVQNMMDMAGSAASIGQGTMRYYSDIADAYGEISDGISGDESIGEHKNTLKESLKEIWESFKQAANETTELNEKFISDYGNTKEDTQIQKQLEDERKLVDPSAPPVPAVATPVANVESVNADQDDVKQKGGNMRNKTFKNRSGGSNNLTRKRRF